MTFKRYLIMHDCKRRQKNVCLIHGKKLKNRRKTCEQRSVDDKKGTRKIAKVSFALFTLSEKAFWCCNIFFVFEIQI